MRPIPEIKANYRLRIVSSGEDGFAAYINHPCYKPTAIAVIASWGGGWEQDFTYTSDIDVNELKTVKLEIKPDTREGNYDGLNKNCLSRKLWINDVLVFEFSKTNYPAADGPKDPAAWCGADIWQNGTNHPGLQYKFGIGGEGNGSITIDSFEYKPIE